MAAFFITMSIVREHSVSRLGASSRISNQSAEGLQVVDSAGEILAHIHFPVRVHDFVDDFHLCSLMASSGRPSNDIGEASAPVRGYAIPLSLYETASNTAATEASYSFTFLKSAYFRGFSSGGTLQSSSSNGRTFAFRSSAAIMNFAVHSFFTHSDSMAALDNTTARKSDS